MITIKGSSAIYEGPSIDDMYTTGIDVNTLFHELSTNKWYYFTTSSTWVEVPNTGGGGSGFTPTQAQLDAMNSGIDSTKVQQISTNETNILSKADKSTTDSLQAQINEVAQAAGTSTAETEIAQARVTADGKTYTTLQARLNAEDVLLSVPHNTVYTNDSANNLIKKHELISGYYVKADGTLGTSSSWNCTDYIDLGGATKICLSGGMGNCAFYDSTKTFTGDTVSSNQNDYSVPATAKYIRCSVNNTNKETAMLNTGSNVLSYDDGYVVIDVKNSIHKYIVVDKSGDGDYTSLSEAMRATKNEKCDYYVRSGEYDIEAEMKTLYGNTYFDNMPSTNYDQGLEIRNGSRVFLDANAVIKFNYAGNNENTIKYFSPFKYSGEGGELHGGQIICSNCRYAIHDDCSTTEHDRRITDGVYIYYRSDRGVAIGGGLGKSSYVELKNCYVDSPLTGAGYGVFYHNNSQSDEAQSFVVIHNNYFTANIIIESLGPSPLISKALVNNNKAYGVIKVVPPAADNPPDIDNFEMIAWANATQ